MSANVQRLMVSSSGILSRGFMTAMDQRVGLASILDPGPPHLTSSCASQPTIHSRLLSRGDLQSSDVQGHMPGCQHFVQHHMRGCPKVVQGHTPGCPKVVPAASSQCVSSLADLPPGHDWNNTSSDNPWSNDLCREFCPCGRTIVSEGLPTTLNQHTGLRSVLDAQQCCKHPLRDDIQPNKLYTVCDLHRHLRPSNNLQTESDFNSCRDTSQISRSEVGSNRPHANERDLQRPSSDPQRPTKDLAAEGDPRLTLGTSSFRHQVSPLCCNYWRPDGNASTLGSSALSQSHAGSSLYDELQPYLSDDDDEEHLSTCSSITTDDDY